MKSSHILNYNELMTAVIVTIDTQKKFISLQNLLCMSCHLPPRV